MALLVTGIVLWSFAHGLRRFAPGLREGLTATLGAGGARGVVALGIGAGLALMIWGFRSAPYVQLWYPPAWTVHLNNLLMLAAVALLGMGHSRGRARSWLRNPMLTAVAVWAVAHLIVNGDLASVILFGGMLIWALAEIALVNATGPAWVRPAPGPLSGDLRFGLITLVVFGVIVAVHTWLGYPPFPR